MKTKKNFKGGQINIRYPGFCDNHPTQCMEVINKCTGGKKKKNRSKKRGGQYASVLKGSENHGVMIDGQTPSELSQFGPLPGNDWSLGLGQNAGVTAQMQADASGPGQAGGKRLKKGGYANLGFKTYPSWCDGKENWSQCGISSTACGSSGGKKKHSRKNKSRKNKSRKNKSRKNKKHIGGSTSLPIQYFGGQLNRYFPAGSSQLNPNNTAYGKTVARSFGTTDSTLLKLNATAPNLAPMGLSSNMQNLSCGNQTGGKQKKTDKRLKKGGYANLGFKTYPTWCDGKENWSQCGISSTACGSSGGKKKYKRNKKGGNGNTEFEIRNADIEIFNGLYKKVDVNDLSDNLRDNELIKEFIETNTNNGRRYFGIPGQEGTFFVKEDDHKLIIYYFNDGDSGAWYIQNLQDGVESQYTYENYNMSVYNAESLPKQGWVKNGDRFRGREVPNLEVENTN